MKARPISRDELKKMIDEKQQVTIIDVRNPDEIANGMIPGAHHIALTDIPLSLWLSPEDWKRKFGFPKPGQHDLIVFYCRTANRAMQAAQHAVGMRMNAAYYPGGVWEWSEIDPSVKRYGPPPSNT